MSFIPSTTGSRSRLFSTAGTLAATCPHATLEPPDTDYEFESDIVDQCVGSIGGVEGQRDIPQRPSSRLGFHSPLPPGYIADTEDPSETVFPEMVNRLPNADTDDPDSVDLASSTFSSIAYDMDEDITAVAISRRSKDDLLNPYPPPFLDLRIDTAGRYDTSSSFLSSDDESEFSDSEIESDYSCDTSDDDFDFSMTSTSLPPTQFCRTTPSLMAPVARLPPSSTQSHHSPPESAELPQKTSPRLPSFKLCHNDHGYSRHALLHLKWFWTLREGKWAECDTEQRDLRAYDGTDSLGQPSHSGPFRNPTQPSLSQHLKTRSPPPRSPILPPMSIHPRRGDVASLRDPYCAHIDRCFVNIPSWTLAKALYMFDVHVGHEWRKRPSPVSKREEDGDKPAITDQLGEVCTRPSDNSTGEPANDVLDDVDMDSENESLGTSASVVSSDDSDATLVESENEGDLEREDYSTFDSFMSDAGPSSSSSCENDQRTPRLKYSSPPSSPTEQQSSKCPILPKLYVQMLSPRAGFFSSHNDDTDAESVQPWATNWYRRWEILMELMRFNWGQDQLYAALSINEQQYHNDAQSSGGFNDANSSVGRKGKRRLKRQPRFFFADGNSTNEDDDASWEWNIAFDLDRKGKITDPGFDLEYKLEDLDLL
ncbi:hypothetical protein AX15_005808 [Amanita polypyramis BW_CC]|nr:hypothetical protein AX15_005808 [Amanita polypyramis BW_CC]